MTNGLYVGGDVELLSLQLINYKNKAADISSIFTEFELYEDIYSASLSGSITIIDTHDLINSFPIIGEEKLKITFKTPGFPDSSTINHIFYVYKLTNILTPTIHKRIYTLHFTTQETITDLNKRISKSFRGTPTTLIEQLLKTDGLNTIKPYELDQSNNNIKFVSPYWTPLKCINYVSSRAQSIDSFKSSHFLFFESNKQYYFKSMNNIFDKSKPNISYNYNNDSGRDGFNRESTRDVAAELTKIYTLTIDTQFDMITRLTNGSLSHWVWEHNLLLKNVNSRFYNYSEHFSKTNHLSDYPITSSRYTYSKNTLMSTVSVSPQTHNGIVEDNYGKIITSKIPLMEQLESFKMDIVVNGRTDLQVGQLINLNVGGMKMLTSDEKYSSLDNDYNGRYLVMSIMHRVSPKKHQMTIQVAKESMNKKYD